MNLVSVMVNVTAEDLDLPVPPIIPFVSVIASNCVLEMVVVGAAIIIMSVTRVLNWQPVIASSVVGWPLSTLFTVMPSTVTALNITFSTPLVIIKMGWFTVT